MPAIDYLSEGGHIGFAPRDDLQLELCRHLLARHGRVSAERIVSGSGLAGVYDFLRLRASEPDREYLDDPAAISKLALHDLPASRRGPLSCSSAATEPIPAISRSRFLHVVAYMVSVTADLIAKLRRVSAER